MADRRRINAPVGGTLPPVYADEALGKTPAARRSRPANTIRKLYLKTGVTPSASGSAYLELESGAVPGVSGLKLSCTVHGPRALPRSTPFSPHMILSAHVKYAPFATRQRRGYTRDASERDLSAHLETALRGVIIADRWPKSGVDVIVSVIEGDQDRGSPHDQDEEAWGMMNVLSNCATVASAALTDAGIDCVDTVAGGVAALVSSGGGEDEPTIVVDPLPSEHDKILAACCVTYLPARDEITNLWLKGDMPASDATLYTGLLQTAMLASTHASHVLATALNEAARANP